MIRLMGVQPVALNFGKKKKRVDAAHTAHTAGVPKYQTPAPKPVNTSGAVAGGCRGQQPGLDEFDLEAMGEGNAQHRRGFRNQAGVDRRDRRDG